MPTATRLMPGTRPTGPILAERRYEIAGKPGQRAVIRVRKPAREPRRGDYRCSVEWVRPGQKEIFECWGIDSMQALQQAIQAAATLVGSYAGELHWKGSKEGYLGFPRTYPDFLPKSLVRKLERMIDREIAANTRKLLAKHKARGRQLARRAAEARTRRGK